ncbi:MAG: hypothetical protein OXQ29_16345 [Rhodospirillaceae bacterium]|nr:hypothetical protein [Rhodospirillaceae bacterium]
MRNDRDNRPALGQGLRTVLRHGRAVVLLPLLLVACTSIKVDPLPEPLRSPLDAGAGAEAVAPENGGPQTELRTSPTPGVVRQKTLAEGAADRLGEQLTGPPIEVSFHGLPLVTFINEVFGERLGMSFVVAPGLADISEVVTLRLTEPLSPRRLFDLARNVLSEYGIALRADDGVITFAPSEDAATGDIPLITSGGRALPRVPDSHRTIFHFVPLTVGGPSITDVLADAFEGQDLDITRDRERGGLLLKGRHGLIEQAIAIIEVLDQPLLRSRHAAILEPAFLEAGLLARELDRVLSAEGYRVGVDTVSGSALLITIEHLNKIIAFAPERAVLEHIKEWARILDDRRQESIEKAWFTYEVRNTQAVALAATLNVVLGGSAPGGAGAARPNARTSGAAATAGAVPGVQSGVTSLAGGLVVDQNRNLILFRGSGRDWAEILKVVKVLDQPVPSVLVEVVVAEVTLSDIENSGFDFLLKTALDRYGVTAGTRGTLGVKSSGLSATFRSGDQTRAMLGIFYEDSRVVIRSRPRILVRSGQTASIEVGNEIPIITQTADSGTQTEGDTNFLQQVSYRKTGVQMDITPIVQASGRVDLDISQSLSEARPTAATSLDGSPTILNRSITTSLTLRDGGALLMGGLISGTQSGGDTGVPGIARVPVLGRLFRADSHQEDRTELVILVIPYVVADYEDGWRLTEQIQDQLELHKQFMVE